MFNKKFKKNNKGFSLVELIIVIAIMAALVAILAPQYIKYVEKSRQAADISAADSIMGAVKTVALDPETYDLAKGGYTVKWAATTGAVTVSAGADTDGKLEKAVQAIVGETIKPKGKDFADTTFAYGTDGKVTVAGATYIENNYK